MLKPLETIASSKGDRAALLSEESASRNKKGWTSLQCVILGLIFMVITGLATNMDRIVDAFKSSPPETQSPLLNNGVSADYDIIVVGAGPAGLLQTNFIQENYPELNILVLEQFNRAGGRSCSSIISYGTPDNIITIDHGAMRFYTTNTRTRRILNYLDLCSHIVPFSNSILRTTSQKTFSARNNYVFEKDLNADFWLNTYNLLPNERILVESQPFDPPQAFYKIIVDQLTIENAMEYPPTTDEGCDEFLNEWTLNGMVLNKWSLSMLIRHFNYSLEFQQLIIDSYGFDNHQPFPAETQFFYEFNALYSPENGNRRRMQSGSTVFTLTTGYRSVPQRLLAKITDPGRNGEVLFNQKVIGIDKNEQSNIYMVNTEDNAYSADQIILALPAEPLQDILPNIPILNNNAEANYLINSLNGNGVMCKMNLIFNDLNVPKEILPSLIDSVDVSLGLGSMYVWFGDNENGVGEGSLTTVHFYNSNSNSCGSWWNLQEQTQESGIYQVGEVSIDNKDDLLLLTVDVVHALMLEFSQFMENKYNVQGINMPIIGTIAPWGVLDRWGATLHRYKLGYNSGYVRERISKPNTNENIFIGVSDWSVSSGFVEGAIAASVDNLQRNFGVNDFLNGISQCSLP